MPASYQSMGTFKVGVSSMRKMKNLDVSGSNQNIETSCKNKPKLTELKVKKH